ncbi:MAG: hypothetical protein K2H23_06320 [Oscillospiraceae bacterium]|nr:hypothetical protein [Oscillospiraceae bacterium]
MNTPFNFSVNITDSERFRRRILYSVSAVLLTLAFTVGFISVYVNTYNVIHDKPMEVLEFDKTDKSFEITVFNHAFTIPKDN